MRALRWVQVSGRRDLVTTFSDALGNSGAALSAASYCRRPFRISPHNMENSALAPSDVLRVRADDNAVSAGHANGKSNAPAPAEALRVKKLSENATLPTRGSSGAAGYDLSSAEDTVVPARGKAIVKTDLQIGIPEGTYARVAPRSGLAAKHSIDVGAGVVDFDYRGNVGVILFNLSDNDFKISVGDRIAQLILEKIMTPPVLEVAELDSTQRGAGGFGSTGVSAK